MSPADRPIASDPWVQNANAGRAGRATRGTTLAPSRISSSALLSLIDRLTPKDHSILSLVRRLRLVSSDQIGRFFSAGEGFGASEARMMRRRLEQLTTWRVLDRLPRSVGGHAGGSSAWVYVVGPAGRRVLARHGIDARRTREPGARYVDHVLAVSECLVQATEADTRGDLELLGWDAEPDCWVSFAGMFCAQRTLRPDLYLEVAAGDQHLDRWWVEMDRSTESLPRILSKCQYYLACMRATDAKGGAHPRVLWVVPTDQRADRIRDVIQSLRPGDRHIFAVAVIDDAVAFIAREARL